MYITSQHKSTHSTHFEVMFGRKAVLPIDIDMERKDPVEKLNPKSDELSTSALLTLTDQRRQHLEEAKANIVKVLERQKQGYDRRRANPTAYDIGSNVLKKDFP